ncbi:hypothetical protein [Saccharopolyspora mangrovi]|uniref:Uncharacterized protein n=1 Tax=Saccharopolyspora mangrovi TaxID=3082379 RepID=A0ABU6AEI8_9PSEU|nr:hypothetical protein [Saccharopolyspora sp. S2-29]MEB3369809.1 hypothetical protein [Saccharopolyspora sp. S2-29]
MLGELAAAGFVEQGTGVTPHLRFTGASTGQDLVGEGPQLTSATPRSDKSTIFASVLFTALALGGLLVMVGSGPRTHRFAVDERGLWWRAGRNSHLIAWEELCAVRGQEPRQPVKGDPNSKATLPALVFTRPSLRNRHKALLQQLPTAAQQVQLRLPNDAVRQLTREIARVRPDLLR